MSKKARTCVASYVNSDDYQKFKYFARSMDKSVAQFVREIIIATIENRMRIIPEKSNHVIDIYGSRTTDYADN